MAYTLGLEQLLICLIAGFILGWIVTKCLSKRKRGCGCCGGGQGRGGVVHADGQRPRQQYEDPPVPRPRPPQLQLQLQRPRPHLPQISREVMIRNQNRIPTSIPGSRPGSGTGGSRPNSGSGGGRVSLREGIVQQQQPTQHGFETSLANATNAAAAARVLRGGGRTTQFGFGQSQDINNNNLRTTTTRNTPLGVGRGGLSPRSHYLSYPRVIEPNQFGFYNHVQNGGQDGRPSLLPLVHTTTTNSSNNSSVRSDIETRRMGQGRP